MLELDLSDEFFNSQDFSTLKDWSLSLFKAVSKLGYNFRVLYDEAEIKNCIYKEMLSEFCIYNITGLLDIEIDMKDEWVVSYL